MPPTIPAKPHTPGTWRLIYFDAPTRGEQIRVLFALAKVPFDDVRVWPFPQGLDPYKKAAMGDESPLLGTDLCPAVTSPTGEHCVETIDIMRFVGRAVGLAPKTEAEDARAMELTVLAQELLNKCFYKLLKPMAISQVLKTEFCGLFRCLTCCVAGRSATSEPKRVMLDQLPKIEEALANNGGGPYFCGDQLTYADAAVFCALRECLAFGCFDADTLQPYPKVEAFMKRLESELSTYFSTRVHEHQLGYTNTIEYLAATNTPFPWSRKQKPRCLE